MGKGEIPDEIWISIICEKYGWTYEEYSAQPWWLIESAKIRMAEEAKKEKEDWEKVKR